MTSAIQTALNNPHLAVTGRVKKWAENPDKNILPVSCTQYFITRGNCDITDLIEFCMLALRGGAGINIAALEFHFSGESTSGFDYLCHIYWDSNKCPVAANCATFFKVADSFLETDQFHTNPPDLNDYVLSIISAIQVAYKHGLYRNAVAFDLSSLRPAGTPSPSGVVASGPESFATLIHAAYRFGATHALTDFTELLSTLVAVVAKGNIYKNGIITLSMPLWHSKCYQYLENSTDHSANIFKAIIIPKDYRFFSASLLDKVLENVNNGTIFLDKIVTQDRDGRLSWVNHDYRYLDRILLPNVCREVYMHHKDTCDLLPVNLGACKPPELPKAYKAAFLALASLRANHPAQSWNLYNQQEKQVGVGEVGLANLLAIESVTYQQFYEDLTALYLFVLYSPIGVFAQIKEGLIKDLALKKLLQDFTKNLDREINSCSLYYFLAKLQVASEAHKQEYKRIFAIAPTASVSFRYKDREGYTLAPNIQPPLNYTAIRSSERDSEFTGQEYEYHPKSELLGDISYELLFNLTELIQRIHQSLGLAHSISFDIVKSWDMLDFQHWANSDLLTTYYMRPDVNQAAQDKSTNFAALINCDCAS